MQSQRKQYTAEQLAKWKRTHKDSRMDSTVRGDAMVLKFVTGIGTTLIPLLPRSRSNDA